MTQYDQFCLICNFSNLFPPKWLRITWNGQFCPIHNFSNLFPLKQLRITLNDQFCSIRNFSNLFPPKQLTITWNDQFRSIHKFSSLIFSHQSCSKSLRTANFTRFTTFPAEAAQNDLELPISPDSQFFSTKAAHFWPNLKIFHFLRGGTLAKVSQICNLLNCFQLENDPQWPILPPKWLGLA